MFTNYKPGRCYIVAEIGGNFTGLRQGLGLVDAAHAAGVDAVKLQTYRADTLASKAALFDMENTGVVSQHALFRQYEIDGDLHKAVFGHAAAKGLDWFSTPSHETDVDLLEGLGVGAYKVGSDDAVNLPFLRYMARLGKPMILSTGMCDLEEVRESVDAILGERPVKLILLHAITSYPTHPENVNLAAMQTLMREFPQLDVGYSDHTLDNTACLCAVAMGARMIEKHFTWDRKAAGPDHMLSADPGEMTALVKAVRDFELMRGDGIKRPAPSERTTRINNRKSVVMEKSARAGERLTRAHLAIKRPGHGIEPRHFEKVVGRTAARDLDAETVLVWEDLR